MPASEPREYAYLDVPPAREFRPCVGLMLAGMAARARIGVGGLEEAVDLLEQLHSEDGPTRYRFSLIEDGVLAEVEEAPGSGEERWRTVVELVS